MKVLCVLGQHNYGDPARGESYEYVNIVPALRRLGHEVAFFECWEKGRYEDYAQLNRALLETVERVEPDVIFAVIFTYEVWLETWEMLRDSGTAATVNWTTDDTWKYWQFSRFVAPAFHAFTTTYPEMLECYAADGIESVLLTQWAANAETLQWPVAARDCSFKVSFIGTANPTRRKWIKELARRGIPVACFGHGWHEGPIAAERIVDIVRHSVINLNFAEGALGWRGLRPYRAKQLKARTFEVPGAGGFLLTEQTHGLERCYRPGVEVAVFSSADDLATTIQYYLQHESERDEIARQGHLRTRNEHTYDARMQHVLEFALQRRDLYFAKRGIRPRRALDWPTYFSAARRHRTGPNLLRLKEALTNVSSLIFGRQRGPRAARRLVFEASWRLNGRHTYSAAGLPGRLFGRKS